MLPSFLRSSYKQYKEDTNSIATWLARTARKCGYPADLLAEPPAKTPNAHEQPKSQRLKGRARKLAREAASKENKPPSDSQSSNDATLTQSKQYIIDVKSFISLAEFIAAYSKPAVRVSKDFLALIDRAIALRKHHAKWYNRTQNPAQLASNVAHGFFIGVLEKVFDLLKARCDVHVEPMSDDKIEEIRMHNIFNALPVEEPEEGFISFQSVSESESITDETVSEVPEQIFVAKIEKTLEEKYFAAHCLFSDVAELRQQVGKLWSVFKTGTVDLIPCALASNIAVDLVKKAQQEFEQEWGTESSYDDLSRLLFEAGCLAQGIDPVNPESGTPFNFDAADLGQWLMRWIYSLLDSFKDVVDDGSMPVLKPDFFGTYDSRADWFSMSAHQRFEQDKRLLLTCLPDAYWLAANRPGVPAEDDLIRLCRHLRTTGKIEFWGVFAAQIFLDANHYVGDNIDSGFKELQRCSRKLKISLGKIFDFQKEIRINTWPKSNDEGLQNILVTMEEFVFDDPVIATMKRMMTRQQRQLPFPPQFRLLKHNPVYCGLMNTHLHLSFQQAGVIFANAWGAIFFLAHLYNAFQQEGYLHHAWADMDMTISFHTVARIFVGNRPQGVEDFERRFCLAIGTAASSFAADRNRRGPPRLKPSKTGPRGLNESIAPVCELFRPQLAGTMDNRNLLLLFNVEKMLNVDTEQRDALLRYWSMIQDADKEQPGLLQKFGELGLIGDQEAYFEVCGVIASLHTGKPSVENGTNNGGEGRLRERFRKRKELSPTELVETLFDAVSYELPALRFDYFTMHRTCWKVLRQLKEDVGADLQKMFGAGWLESETQLPFIVGYILTVARQTKAVAEAAGHSEVPTINRTVAAAAHSLNAFLGSGFGSWETARLLLEEQSNMRLEDIEFRRSGPDGEEDVEHSSDEEEEAFDSVMAVMAAFRTV